MSYQGQGSPRGAKTNSGYLVPNDMKKSADSSDYRGLMTLGEDVVAYIMQGGRAFYLDAWSKQAKNPKTGMMGPLLSISVKPKVAKAPGGYGGQNPGYQPQQPAHQAAWGGPPGSTVPQQPGTWQAAAPQQPQYHAAGQGFAGQQAPVQRQPQQQGWPGQVDPTGRTAAGPGPGGFIDDVIPF